jgi:polysaccharide biosynthesis/export protein
MPFERRMPGMIDALARYIGVIRTANALHSGYAGPLLPWISAKWQAVRLAGAPAADKVPTLLQGESGYVRSYRLGILLAALALSASACSTLPGDGPLSSTVVADRDNSQANGYEVIDIDEPLIKILANFARRGLERTFGNTTPAPHRTVGIGDVVTVSIWEAAPGGLFSSSNPTGSRAENLPPQTVDSEGRIRLPFVGDLQVNGLTTGQVGALIEKRLQGKAIEPQVLVAIQQTGATTATVAGDVTGAARVTLNPKGDHLMEVVAQAGGVKASPHETFVRVTRGAQTSTVSLATVLERPSENIYVHPGDLIYLFKQPQSFTALGAVTKSGELAIDREYFTMAEALGVAGGLNDAMADTGGVFLFRFENPEVLRALRPKSPLLAGSTPVPVIYRLSFATPSAYFMAKSFLVNTQDVIYVANSPSVEFLKFVSVVRALASTARSIKAADPNL